MASGYTQSDIDKLRAVIASGAKSVKYSDRGVEYNDIGELRALLSQMEKTVNGTTNVRLIATRKGF